MPPHPPLPRVKKHRDLPPWKHDVDNVRRRVANAGWAALYKRDWSDVSFRELAEEVGVTTAALYHHFPTLSALALEIAIGALSKLRGDMVNVFNRGADTGQKPRVVLRKTLLAYWAFARKRPRHLELAFSPQFTSDTQINERRESIRACLQQTIEVVTGNDKTGVRVAELWPLVHGAACLIAAGRDIDEEALLTFIERHVVVLDGAARHP
jgi:AcrR family transcriptional regulator